MIASIRFPLGIATGVSVPLQRVTHEAGLALAFMSASLGTVHWERRLQDNFRIPPDQYAAATEQLVTGYGIANPEHVDIEKVRKFIGELREFHGPSKLSLDERILGAVRQESWILAFRLLLRIPDDATLGKIRGLDMPATDAKQARHKALTLLAKQVYRQLRQGYEAKQLVALLTELLSEIKEEGEG